MSRGGVWTESDRLELAAVAAMQAGCGCGPGTGGAGRGGRRVSEVERRGSLPRSIHHCTYGENATLLFNSLSVKGFFCGFCFVF